ncbi:MAG TPA: BON domain-containing protein [Gemmatirosa sp.]
MPNIRYRDRDSSAASALFVAVGALAGLAAGVLIAQRMGGISGISARVRDRLADARGEGRDTDDRPMAHDQPEYDDEPLDANAGAAARGATGRAPASTGQDDDGEALEERVLEAFRNDPVLSERAVDIGAIGRGIIELTGFVQAESESHGAVVLTRGVPGVVTVVNRLEVREEEARFEQTAAQYEAGDVPGGAMWEGQQVGIGRPRQGTSGDLSRHADPKPTLENRWTGQQASIRSAADDLEGIAERRQNPSTSIAGDETGGAPIAPSGVPKGDHVADPASAAPFLRETTGRVDPNLRD